MKVDLRPQAPSPRRSQDLVEDVGVKYTPAPTFGDAFSAAKHSMRQRALEERTRSEFTVSVACSVTTSDGTTFGGETPISPRDVHGDESRARAALLALVRRGVVVQTYPDEIAERTKGKR